MTQELDQWKSNKDHPKNILTLVDLINKLKNLEKLLSYQSHIKKSSKTLVSDHQKAA